MAKLKRDRIENIVREELGLFEASKRKPNAAQLRKMISRPGFPDDPRHPLRKKLKDLEASEKEKRAASKKSNAGKNIGWGANSGDLKKFEKATKDVKALQDQAGSDTEKFLITMLFQMNMMISSAINKIIDSPSPEFAAQEWADHWIKERDDLWNLMQKNK